MEFKLKQLEECYGLDFYQNRTFFMVQNSDFCKKLAYESQEVYTLNDLFHYAVIGQNEILDVVSIGQAIIEFVE